MANAAIPTVDLSPFFSDVDLDGQKNARNVISQACSEYGFFQIVNHDIPVNLISQVIELSRTFFAYSEEEKLKYTPGKEAPLPAGYNKQPENSPDKNEYLLMFPPESTFNMLPRNPQRFREALEELFSYFSKTAQVLETILNDCLNLPPNFLKEYNQDRSWDFMVALRYFSATELENNGLSEHEDGNLFTLVIQDEVGGLEVQKDGEWLPVIPSPGTVVVNISDVIQVLTNDKFKSATHRVVRSRERSRHSIPFFYNLHGDKWVEPLPEFTEKIREKPKYRGFLYKEYQALRMKNKSHPPDRLEDVICIKHYAIST